MGRVGGGSVRAVAGGQVGGGTPGSCNQPALEAKLAGGGLVTFNCGTALVVDSAFIDNFALGGGGLVTSGTLTISNTTFAGNTAFGGGGMLVQSGTLTLLNSTLAGNVGVFGAAAIAVDGSAVVSLKNTLERVPLGFMAIVTVSLRSAREISRTCEWKAF